MRTQYPVYRSHIGDIKRIKESLNVKNKTELDNFSQFLLRTNKQPKVDKILRLLIQFYDITGLNFYDKPSVEIRDKFLALLNNSHYKKSYKREVKVYVKKWLLWKWKDLLLIEDFPKLEKNEPDWKKVNETNLLNEGDVKKLILGEKSSMWKCYLTLIWQTGARPEEILKLTWDKIEFNDTFADVSIFSNKTEKSRTYPIKELKWINEWKEIANASNKDYIFPSPQNKKVSVGVAGANYHLKNLASRIGLKKDIWNYLFRFSRATQLYDSMPIKAVEQLLGHSGMYKIYQQMSNKKAREMLLQQMRNEEIPTTLKEKLEKEIEQLKQNLKESISKSEAKNIIQSIIKETVEELETNFLTLKFKEKLDL